jgi:hypothetical protein
MRRLPPAWFLFFFAPLTVEYVSGSSPYLNPFVLVANLLLYGAGTLLIRELKVRWGKGWLAIFILAAAYMVAEEGLMLNTLFDPTKNATGRSLGVNWVWTAGMLVVHSLVSIFVPILVAEAIYDEQAREPWIKPRTFWWLLAAFAANVFGLGRLIAPTNRPGVLYYLIEAAFIGGCLWLASRAPAPRAQIGDGKCERSPARLFAGSLVGMAVTMVVNFAAPTLAIPAVVKVVAMLAVYLAFLEWLRRSGMFHPGLDPLSKFAGASGIISFWILVSPLTAFGKGNIGPVFFGTLVAVFLVSTQKRLKKRLPIPWTQGTERTVK